MKLSWSSASFTVISPERVVSGLLATFPAARRHCLWTNQAEAGAQNSDEPAQPAAGWRAFFNFVTKLNRGGQTAYF